jgi:chemotaxis protein histidine kinase CheA
MTGAPGFLEFFILEASEYVEQLDAILLGGGATGPDADALQRLARALRGTATMAKMPSFAELATSVERVGRALNEGLLRWDPALGGALVAAIDDLKTLLRSARSWSTADDERARARSAELSRYAPARTTPTPSEDSAQPSGDPAPSFLATEAANIAAGLELMTTRAGDVETASNVLRRVRALRGVAGVKEVAALAEVLEATEEAARGLESGKESMSPEARRLLEASAVYLRTLASPLREGADVNAPSLARDGFLAAQDAWASHAAERELVVPIAELFYADGGPDVVEAAANPPTSASDRFRLELVSLGEHLRQVVDAARRANDTASGARARRDLRGAIRALQAAAESFGERQVAQLIGNHAPAADQLDKSSLAKLDDLASLLAEPGARGERLNARLREVASGSQAMSSAGGLRDDEAAPEAAAPQPAAQPVAPEPVPPQPVATPSAPATTPVAASAPLPSQTPDRSAAALLDSSIAALEALPSHPFGEPTPIPEDTVVPIESLLYRGRAALDRALEMRDELRRAGPQVQISALDELFDLLELARAE